MDGELKEEVKVPEEMENELGNSNHEEVLGSVEAEAHQESMLVQREDGSWEHAENSPFSPFYVPDRKQKKNNGITIALVALLLVLLVAGLIFAVSKLVEAAMGEATTAWNESTVAVSEFWDTIKEEWAGRADEKVDFFEDEVIEEWPDDGMMPFAEEMMPDYYDSEAWDKFLRDYAGIEEYEGYDSDDFYYEDGMYVPRPEDEYYLELTDSVREDLSYSVVFEDYIVNDDEETVNILIQYAQVIGDIPAIDEINGYLEEGAMYYATYFDSISATDLWLDVETYVTYMDEEMLSVVVDERYVYGEEQYYHLYCMNFDLTTGSLWYNTDMIEVSEELVDAFKKQSDYQNGESYAVSQYSDEEIMDLLSDEGALILYYSPVGLEVGYNYPDGWITVTFKDYERFLRTL